MMASGEQVQEFDRLTDKSDADVEAIELSTALCPEGAVPIYLVLSGSHSYGLETPESDRDYRGVYIPSPRHFFGLADQEGPRERKEPDIVMMSLAKFVRLALKCNPNIIEQLFIPKAEQIDCGKAMIPLLETRKMFLSRRAHHSYSGYAVAQLKKLRTGRTRDLGAKRKQIVEKFGYDCKNAMHCFRLLLQGEEILTTGNLTVRVSGEQRAFLRDVRAGKVLLGDLLQDAERRLDRLDALVHSSPLPEVPDEKNVEAVLEYVQSGAICGCHY